MKQPDHEDGQQRPRIMVVDDDIYLLTAIKQTLLLNNYSVDTLSSAQNILPALTEFEYAAVITDIKMPGMDGIELLDHIKKNDPELPVIMITGHGDVSMAVSSIKDGAYDFLQKPVDEDVLLASLSRAVEKRQLVLENRTLNRQIQEQQQNCSYFHGLVGKHPSMLHLYETIKKVAAENDPVMLYGETGTGKELVARAIHEIADRSKNPFVAINMGAIPVDMIESDLFGHVKGAFTGAVQEKIGKFSYAGEGTLFFDEINSLPIGLQTKLLRVLEEKTITPLGSNVPVPVYARIIAATNKDLSEEICKGNFRQDLFFRLNVLPVTIPPLKERREDIPLLIEYYRQAYCHERQQEVQPLDRKTIRSLQQEEWPGNVRELKNYVRRLCIFGSQASQEDISQNSEQLIEQGIKQNLQLKSLLEEVEKKYLIEILSKNQGQITPTYQDLGISRKSLYDKVNKYDIDLASFRQTV
ncbi:MAG: sigma-54 dependent transcriptional regulator [Proteobacteria bacterium]|nr:sigma-54 dependent transcriptional regulator [Pseudomonadota bacterium]MBU1059191.1 sigma-54 dependent transcriptional regulator [Pseudomonadota bacterium]